MCRTTWNEGLGHALASAHHSTHDVHLFMSMRKQGPGLRTMTPCCRRFLDLGGACAKWRRGGGGEGVWG